MNKFECKINFIINGKLEFDKKFINDICHQGHLLLYDQSDLGSKRCHRSIHAYIYGVPKGVVLLYLAVLHTIFQRIGFP